MTYTPPRQAHVADWFTAPWYNTEIRDNFAWMVRPAADPITTEKDVSNTIVATNLLLPDGFTLPGGALGTKGALRGFVAGDYANSSTGGSRSFNLALSLGATVIFQDSTQNLALSPDRHSWFLEFTFANCGATNSNFCVGAFYFSKAGGAVAGVGDLGSTSTNPDGPAIMPIGSLGKTTINTAVDQNLAVTVTHSFQHTGLSMRREYAVFEYVGQGAV